MKHNGEEHPDERGHWILTQRGAMFHLADPQPSEVWASDIAHSLSQLCRYSGHTKGLYTVGHHVLFVSEMARKYAPRNERDRYELLGLMHDFEEAYTGDINAPLKLSIKEQPGMAEWWRDLELRINKAIHDAFEVPMPTVYEERIIKFYDVRAFVIESSWVLQNNPPGYANKEMEILRRMAKTNKRLIPVENPLTDEDHRILLRLYGMDPAGVGSEILKRLSRLLPGPISAQVQKEMES